MKTLKFQITFRRLLIGLVATVVPISILALYTVPASRRNFEKVIAAHLQGVAASTAIEVADFVHYTVLESGVMAANPTLMDAVNAANRSYQGMREGAFINKVRPIQEKWNTAEAAPVAEKILSNPASRLLNRYRELDKRFLRITVANEKGVIVAATHKPQNYYQGDLEFWERIHAGGRGSISLSDVEYDPVTKSNYIEIGMPILEPGSGRFVGTMEALIEVSSIFPVINRAQASPTIRAFLMRQDGEVISGLNLAAPSGVKAEEYQAVRDWLSAADGRPAGYVVTNLKQLGFTLIGFADTGLKKDYKDLAWSVVISQPTRDAFAPVRQTERLIELMILIGLLAVIFLAVYFSLHRENEIQQIEEEFNPQSRPKVP
ncbi:MAG TPA: cache domain-containing protein [Bryobacterales bacterium]|nr:cache domain-containing protein [Bryobacterales bacterium]